MSDEAELFRRWRAGSAEAGEILLRACFNRLFRFFRNKVSGDVDDLIQQTLLHCVESRERVRDPDQLWAFLYRVARNRLHDRLRRELRLGDHVVLGDTSLEDMGASPSSEVARDERERLVMAALRRIPLDYQIALELLYWEQLTTRQIAEVLGVNHNTVRSRVNRARAALREQLEAAGVGASTVESLLPR